MPLLTAVLPDVEPAAFRRLGLQDRLKIATRFWVDNGFGTPRYVHIIYLLKATLWYGGGGLLVISLTSDVGGLSHLADWWTEPIVYVKVVVWTMLLEVLGIGGAWGPLTAHFKPMTGGARYWLRPGTIRVAPWRRVPLTSGDSRSAVDVLLYVALLAGLVTALVLPERPDGRPEVWAVVLPVVLVALAGLRDSIIFLAARGEQYVPALVFAALLGSDDMVMAAKVLIVSVWLGAGVSKLGHHFVNVIAPMVSNAPFVPSSRFKRLHYRNAPDDLRPSGLSWFLAHIGGTTVEIVTPIVLLVSTNETVTACGVTLMIVFHIFIAQLFPLAVPLEWNVAFAFFAAFLFIGYPNGDGFAVWDFSGPDWAGPWLIAVFAACLVFFPVLGNNRPDLVSFLPSMRQYAGNWASAVWAYQPEAEQKMLKLNLPVDDMTSQLQELLDYDRDTAELSMGLVPGWRALHSQGRGLYSLLLARLPDVDERIIREGEFMANWVRGWNFGDGHLHDERLIAAIQRRVGFEPGELVVVWVESEAIGRGYQNYKVIDAALGVVERGRWQVRDAVAEQPWLPNGPIPLEMTWRDSGWQHGVAAAGVPG